MISFHAHKISNVVIKRLNYKSDATDYNASFVELNTSSKEDLVALKKIGRTWEKGGSYAADIYDMFSYDYLCSETFNNTRYFALTTQKQDFENLDAYKILGVVSVSEKYKDRRIIQRLQVEPSNTHYSPIKKFKGIGSSIVKTLQNMFKDRDLEVVPDSIKNEFFYEKLGFKFIPRSIYMKFKI